MSDELTQLGAGRLAELIRARAVSPVEIMEAHLDRIERVNPALNAIVTLALDVMERAREAEAAIIHQADVGPLHGIPFTVKDTIETTGLRTTSGSLLRASHVPDADAPAVARLRAAGAIVLGKTNVPEMAIPYECDNPVFGRTNNPHSVDRTSGGSSGGEASAISACLSPVGLGSDLSGSIRVPAHFCGIAGLSPTPGLIPASGHFPSVSGPISTGAVIGPMARSIDDISLLLSVLAEVASGPSSPQVRTITNPVQACRIASHVESPGAPVNEETLSAVNAALRALGDAGFVVVDDKPPGIDRAANLWSGLFAESAAVQMRELYRGQEAQAGPRVRSVLSAAETVSPENYRKACLERDGLRTELIRWMHITPFIVAPVGAVPAFEHGARRVDVEGQLISVFSAFAFSRVVNVLGLPSVCVPAGSSRDGLPIGVQVIGRPYEDVAVLGVASIIEQSLGGWMAPSL